MSHASSTEQSDNLETILQPTPVQLWQAAAIDTQGESGDAGGDPPPDSGTGDEGGEDGGSPDDSGTSNFLDGDGKPPSAPPTWPDDWRAKMAGGDEDVAARLQRFASPDMVLKSYLSLEKKMKTGGSDLPENASEEQLAAWRKEHGIPETPDGYYEHLGDLSIGDDDKPLFDAFFKDVIHANNLPPSVASAAAGWYYDLQQQKLQEQFEQDSTAKNEAEKALQEDWGGEYIANRNALKNHINGFPEETRELFMNARAPDGSMLFNNPAFIKHVLSIEKTLNPSGMVVPPGKDSATYVADRISEIEGIMRDNRPRYDRDERMQAELRDLYRQRERMEAKA